MKEDFKNKFDLSIRRRRYYFKEFGQANCPEWGMPRINHNYTVMLTAKSDIDEGEFMTNMTGSHFCQRYPVVVLDTVKLEFVAQTSIKGNTNVQYNVMGIVNIDAVPKHKSHLSLDTDANPIPLIKFLPNNQNKVEFHKKTG